MMRNLFYWALSLLLLLGCSKEPESVKDDSENPDKPKNVTLELSLQDLVFEVDGGRKTFVISCNSEWTIENNSDWCKTDFSSGTGNLTVTVITESYDGMEDRNTNLTVKAGDKTQVLGVTQKYRDAIVLSKDKFEVPQEGKTISVEVKSNISYEVTIPEEFGSWIAQAPESRAVTTKSYDFTVSATDSTDVRSGFIVFSGNSLSDTVWVYQAQRDSLLLSQSYYDLSLNGGTFNVELRTNVDYDVIIPDSVSWVSRVETRALRTDKLSFSVSKNDSRDDRSTSVRIKDRNSSLYSTLYIYQSGKGYLELSHKSFTVPQEGGKLSVSVESNTSYSVTIPLAFRSWITQLPSSRASTTKEYNFNVSANENPESRTGYVVFTGGNAVKDTVYVFQAQKDYLQLSPTDYDFLMDGGNLSVTVQANVDYEFIVPSDITWISVSAAGVQNKYSLVVAENESFDAREGAVIVKANESDLSDTLHIHQAGKVFVLSALSKSQKVSPSGMTISIYMRSNISYDVTIPEEFQNWISAVPESLPSSRAVSTRKHSFVIAENEKQDFREGYIVFSGEGLTEKVTVNQLCGSFTATVLGMEVEFVYVEGGTFDMGATEEQGSDAGSDEKPVHPVILSSYYIGKYEVTQGLWEKVMGTTIEQQRAKAGSSNKYFLYGVGSDYPMYYVSWDEASAFADKLGALIGRKCALPTEAQWEYAARGGNKSKGYKYSGGDAGWYNDKNDSTHPVGQKLPNELGIYDMSGNVAEWCADWYNENYYSDDFNFWDPTGPASGFHRVCRGGSWFNNARSCRVSDRGGSNPSYRNFSGFRVVLLP